MITNLGYFFYHHDNHIDIVKWFDTEDYTGWVVTECNCILTNAALLPDAEPEIAEQPAPHSK